MEEDLKRHYRFRRMLILMAIWVMMVISIYQYSWSLFSFVMARELHWDLATVGLAFTVFVYTATFIQPLSGYIADSFGPRAVSVFAALLTGLGFLLSSRIDSPAELYFYYGLGGIGVGILYGISTASAVKWFPDKRGSATGLVVFGFGAGTALFNWLLQKSLDSYGFRPTFQYLGLFMFLILVPAALFYKYPPEGWLSSPGPGSAKSRPPRSEWPPSQMVKTYQWYLMYFCFSFTVSVVLLFGAQLKMLAREYQLPQSYFNLLLILFPLANGLSRLLSGAVSDKLGREKTMMVFYSFLGISILALLQFGNIPILFLSIVFIAALLGGAPFALYPATVGDYYGSKYSTVNYGITYTAKAWAGLISGWVSGYLVTQLGSYKVPLILVAVGSIIAALFSNPKFMRSPIRREEGSKEG